MLLQFISPQGIFRSLFAEFTHSIGCTVIQMRSQFYALRYLSKLQTYEIKPEIEKCLKEMASKM